MVPILLECLGMAHNSYQVITVPLSWMGLALKVRNLGQIQFGLVGIIWLAPNQYQTVKLFNQISPAAQYRCAWLTSTHTYYGILVIAKLA